MSIDNSDDYFTRRVIKTISQDIHESVLVKLREAARGKTLKDQLEMVVAEAMKTYQEPDILKGRNTDGAEQPTTSGSRPVTIQRNSLRPYEGQRIGKDAASGTD